MKATDIHQSDVLDRMPQGADLGYPNLYFVPVSQGFPLLFRSTASDTTRRSGHNHRPLSECRTL